MKVRLIGAGAVGLTVSHRLRKIEDFALIVDDSRIERYQEDGLLYNGERLNLEMFSPKNSHEADVIIIATKNFHLDKTIETIKPFVKEGTILISLLNGVVSEEELEKAFPNTTVLYSFITNLSANHSDNHTICFSKDGGTIYIGTKSNESNIELERVIELFDQTGITYINPKDIHHEIWWKFMLNSCFNSLSAVLLADYEKMNGNQVLIRCVRLLAKEIQIVAKEKGVILTQDDIEKMINTVMALRGEGKTSMLQDVEAKRENENRYFLGSVSALGKRCDIETPFCDFVYNLVEAQTYAQKQK